MTTVNCLIRIGRNMITYKNDFPLKNQTLPSETEVNYIQDIIFARDTVNIGMSMKEVIKVVSDIVKADSYLHAYNKYDRLILEERLSILKRNGYVSKY